MMPAFEAKMPMIARRCAEVKGGSPSRGEQHSERGILAEPAGTLVFRAICFVKAARKGQRTLLRRFSSHFIPETRVAGNSD